MASSLLDTGEYSIPRGFAKSPIAHPRFEPAPTTTFTLGESLLPAAAAAAESKSTPLATFFNLINNYVGMVLLSMHFTFARSGWLALPMLALLTAFGAFTGDCIVDSVKKIQATNPDPRYFPSYAEIGDRCLGAFGKWLVVVSSLIENIFAIFCMLIIIWSNAQLLLPSFDPNWVIAGCVLLSFPTNWLRDYSLLSFLSAFGLFCVLLIIAAVLIDVMDAYALEATDANLDSEGWVEPTTVLAEWSGLPMSGSIMLAGLTGHVGLPPMYAEMKTPSAFRPTFYLSFLAMLAMYAVVGIGGYLLYGTASHVLITEDMAEAAGKSAFAQFLVTLVLGSITFKLFCGVPLSVLITVDIIQDLYQEGSGQRMSERQADWMRLAIWAGSVVTALAIMPYLQYVTALVGINSMLISVLLPLLFYVQLHREMMGPATQAAYAVLVACSVVGSLVISYADIEEFLQKLGVLAE